MMFNMSEHIKRNGLANYLEGLIPDIALTITPSEFAGSPFEFLVGMPIKQRGTWGEEAARLLAEDCGIWVSRAPKGDGDWEFNGTPVEVKLAMQSRAGTFTLNQIRDDSGFKYLVALLIMPEAAMIYTIPKSEIVSRAKRQHSNNNLTYTADISKLYNDFPAMIGVNRFMEVFSEA